MNRSTREAEEILLGTCLDGGVPIGELLERGVCGDYFQTPDGVVIWQAVVAADNAGSVDTISVGFQLSKIKGHSVTPDHLIGLSEKASGSVVHQAVEVLACAKLDREETDLCAILAESIKHGDGSSAAEARAGLLRVQSERELSGGAAKKLDAFLDRHRFDPDIKPEPLNPIFRLGNHIVGTVGNIGSVGGQGKSGKTALLTAIIAAPMDPEGDVFGLESHNPNGYALIHLDTEQSSQDRDSIVRVALERAGKECPKWFFSYHLLDLPIEQRLPALERALIRHNREQGGIHSVALDGIADFLPDPNDTAASFAMVERLHQLANEYQTFILCALHFNPSTEGKMRGHLGSQLERKAETNLRLEKDTNGITTIFADRARHCLIPKADGPRFKWDDRAGMHLSVGTQRAEQATEKRGELEELADEVFSNGAKIRWGDLRDRIADNRKWKPRTAELRIREMGDHDVIRKTYAGFYERVS
jgi:hypothetical protein